MIKTKINVLALTIVVIIVSAFSFLFFGNTDLGSSKELPKVANNLEIINGSAYIDNTSNDALSNNHDSNAQLIDKKSFEVSSKSAVETAVIDDIDVLVKPDSSVDGVKLTAVMTSDKFSDTIDNIVSYKEKSNDTIQFESSIDDYINHSKYNAHFNDYKISCDNKICLGYFKSFSKDELDSFINEFSNGSDSPLRRSGFVNYYIKEKNGNYEYRISFNSDPSVQSIVVPNNR